MIALSVLFGASRNRAFGWRREAPMWTISMLTLLSGVLFSVGGSLFVDLSPCSRPATGADTPAPFSGSRLATYADAPEPFPGSQHGSFLSPPS